ncbi:hypothetical protein LC613_05195 [Nostoc sphaeroides CHAB 2801]|uniref:hypothetical protein n=1 Tax=Nostoc sphaeroides TaxID=446679 RepID=UPI0011C1614A|nr:hypothetical protein [Nostoc sphaeroides]MCC5627578.1 hypothetical protein [Nostoc sphaeroides CHAB 2801]
MHTTFRVLNTTFRVLNTNFRVPNTTFRVLNTNFRVPNTTFRVPNTTFRVPNTTFRVLNTNFRVPNTIFRVLNTIFRVPISKDGNLSLSNDQYYLKARFKYTRRGTALPCPYTPRYNVVPHLNGNRYNTNLQNPDTYRFIVGAWQCHAPTAAYY